MKFTLILISLLINFFCLSFVKSEEIVTSERTETENFSEEGPLNKKQSKIRKIHIVKLGDTLSSISKSYSIEKKIIIKLNDIKDENYIFIGQNLIIHDPNEKFSGQNNLNTKESKMYHIVKVGENLTEISTQHKVNLEYLKKINNIENPDSIKIGEKILLSKADIVKLKPAIQNEDKESSVILDINKKQYGPLIIQSKYFKKKNGRKIISAFNQDKDKLILSISCERKQLDVRIPGRKWRGWESAKEEFEKNLLNDFCKN